MYFSPIINATIAATENGTIDSFGFFIIYGTTIAPIRAGNILSKAGFTTEFDNSGSISRAKNNMPRNTIKVVTIAEDATAIIATIFPLSEPSSHPIYSLHLN